MAFLDGKRDRAAILIVIVGLAVTIGLWPYSSGLIGAPVLYVAVAPMYRWLNRRLPATLAALLCILVVAVLVLGLGGWIVTLLVQQARELSSGVITGPTLAKLQNLRVGPFAIGEKLQAAAGEAAQSIGAWALSLLGTATRTVLQLTIAFFGLFFLLTEPHAAWNMIEPLIPFSTANSERLRRRFKDVTASTLMGTIATAAVQALFVAAAFWAVGFPNIALWGAVTFVVSILPVIGSGVVWLPGAIILAVDHRYVAAGLLVFWCLIVVGNIDNLIRPWIFRRFAQIHPFTTIIGAFGGIEYFGLLGLMIGPLMISYFFELIEMYREEYGDQAPSGA